MHGPKVRAFFNSHMKTVFIVWTHYDNKPEKHGFIVYRNGVPIAEHKPDDEKWGPFGRCSKFNRDHNTNLFHKYDARYELMYEEENLPMYQEFEYKVEKIRYSEDGKILSSVMSRPVYVRTE